MFSLLNDLVAKDNKKYGSKAATLGRLSKLGVNVPKGFAISIDAYLEFLNFNQFEYQIEDYLSQNEKIIDFIIQGVFPDKIIKTLQHYFYDLNTGMEKKCFVVRSSSICEDAESHSMAGIFSSFVNLNSYDQLVESIKKCYASLFSDKALSMMLRYNIPLNDLKMGIIIQEFISGSMSGVAFSADAVKMDSDVVVINSVNSICSDYVDGKYPSSQYKIRKSTNEIIGSSIAQQAQELTQDELIKINKKITAIESYFNNYQDVEWTINDSSLYILQARPITTFRSHKIPDGWFKYNINDTLTLQEDKALTPLQQDIRIACYSATCKGWEYSSKGRNGRFKICNGYYYNAVDERDWDKRAKFRAMLDELFADGKNIFQDIQLPQLLSLREELKSLLKSDMSIVELENAFYKSKQLFELSVEMNMSAVDGAIPLESFEKHCKSLDSNLSKDEFYNLVYGISKLSEERQIIIELSILVKSNAALMRYFDTIQYDEVLYYHLKGNTVGNELLKGIDDYLNEYGLINIKGQWKFDFPVIQEQPWCVIGKIRTCLNIDSDLFFYSREESLNNKKTVIEKLTKNMNNEDKLAFMKKLRGAEKAFLINDDHCFYLDLSGFGYFRIVIMKTANMLKRYRIINKDEDIKFLTFDEIINIFEKLQGGDLRIKYQNIITKRKYEHNLQKNIIPPTYIGIPPVKTVSNEIHNPEENVNILKGDSGLRKKVTGKVKVITDNFNMHVDEDVILVLKNGHSCYFLPFISKVKGLIYDNGSPYDHPGIIARELLIPSLYNTKNATKVLKDGDEVELDGINECVILKGSL